MYQCITTARRNDIIKQMSQTVDLQENNVNNLEDKNDQIEVNLDLF